MSESKQLQLLGGVKMKKLTLWIATMVLVFSLSACTNNQANNDVNNDLENETTTSSEVTATTGSNTTTEVPAVEEESSTSEEDNNTETEKPTEVNTEIVKLSDDEATVEYKLMIERLDNESPIDVYDDMLELLPQFQDQKGAILFTKFDQYLQDWSMNYTDQMYFESGPMSKLNKSLSDSYDYETDSYDLDLVTNETHRAILESLFSNGFKFIWLEGEPYPFIDYSQLKVLNDSVSEEVMAFIIVMATETDNISSADAGLIIDWNELAYRINQTESALKLVKNEELHGKLESMFRFYSHSYLLGMSNTPVVDWESNKILPEVLDSYEKTMTNYKGSEIASIIEKYMSTLGTLDFVLPYSDQEQFQAIVATQEQWINEAAEHLHKH